MSLGINIVISKDTATPFIRAQMESLTPERLAARVGPAVQNLVETHLAKLGPNKQGYPSTGFYEQFARNVRWSPLPNGLVVGILPVVIHGRTVGLRQRIEGGTITPRVAKMLAIPMCAEAYGRVPSDFPDAFLIKTPKGYYLVQAQNSGHAGRRSPGAPQTKPALTFLFVLKLSVTQEPDRAVLPSDQQITDTALAAIAGGNN